MISQNQGNETGVLYKILFPFQTERKSKQVKHIRQGEMNEEGGTEREAGMQITSGVTPGVPLDHAVGLA